MWMKKELDADVRRLTQIKSFFVLGGGSNVIISDDGLDAVISTRKMNKIKFLTEGSEYTESLIKREKLLNPEISLCSPKPYEHSSSGDSLKSRCDFLTLPTH